MLFITNKKAVIATTPQKIILIDDSEIICKRLNSLLAELPFVEVLGQALNDTEAKQLITLLKPDTVLLDINIPFTNGFEILVWLRKSAKRTCLPIYRKKSIVIRLLILVLITF